MIKAIIKRDGREVPFDIEKIAQAVRKAFEATGHRVEADVCIKLARQVEERFEVDGIEKPTVEQTQDVVEAVLIQNGYVRTAKAYILYRADRTRAREMKTRLMQVYDDITFSDASASDLKRENANIDGNTPMGAMLKYGSEGAKQFYDMFVLEENHARAHREGDIHIHDLDFLALTTTCCQIDLLKLFSKGFSTGHGILREPKDIQSYSALCCIAIQANQNDQHGGQSVPNFDYGMAPGVAKTYRKRYMQNMIRAFTLLANAELTSTEMYSIFEKAETQGHALRMGNTEQYQEIELPLLINLGVSNDVAKRAQEFSAREALKETERATYQAMEALVHNLNTMHSRAGAQTPFSSINYGTDTSPEGRMVMRNILLATEAGLGEGETAIFPIQIFRVKEGINYSEGDPNYDLLRLAIRVSAKRLYPNFAFQDAPFNIQYYREGRPETEIAYMGCRTRVIGNVFDPAAEVSPGRGNLSFTSINLPRLGIKAGKNIEMFFELLDGAINLCINQILERFELQARKTPRNYPFLMGAGVWHGSENLGPNDELREILKHGSLSVGFIGLAETLVALTGQHHGQAASSQNLGLEIIAHIRRRLDIEAEARKMNFTLLATPAEGLSGRFVSMDRKRYGEIPGVTDREYYTNSFHIPVYFPLSALEKIRLEAPYHALTNAGHITYIEMDGDPSQNLEAFEMVIRAMREAGIGYGSVNHPVDRDPICLHQGIIGDECPKCGRKETEGMPFARIRRVTGYLGGTLDRFNNAKRAEVRDRVKHALSQ